MTKRPRAVAAGAILYHDIGDYLSREDKLRIVREFGSAGGVEEAEAWTRIVPDEHGDWPPSWPHPLAAHVSLANWI